MVNNGLPPPPCPGHVALKLLTPSSCLEPTRMTRTAERTLSTQGRDIKAIRSTPQVLPFGSQLSSSAAHRPGEANVIAWPAKLKSDFSA